MGRELYFNAYMNKYVWDYTRQIIYIILQKFAIISGCLPDMRNNKYSEITQLNFARNYKEISIRESLK